MLIVNKLLFKPMFKLMDERNKIIENAAHKKTEMENAQLEYEKKLSEAAENAKKNENERAEAMLAEARTEAAEKIMKAEEISKNRLALAKTDVEFGNGELDSKLNENVDKLAETFISHLIS